MSCQAWKWLGIVAAAATFSGCGGSATGPKTVPLSGTVQLDQQPVPDAEVQFTPEKGPQSYARTDASGKFVLKLSAGGNGAVLGKHAVRVTVGLPSSDGVDAAARGEAPTPVTAGPPKLFVFPNPIAVEASQREMTLNLNDASPPVAG